MQRAAFALGTGSVESSDITRTCTASCPPAADDIAEAVKLDMSEWFKATADNYFSRVSKASNLEALKEAKGEITPAMEKAKKGELAAIAEREIGKVKWLPTLLCTP